MQKTILIADDHPVYLLGLRTLLQTRSDRYRIIHEALNADDMMDKLAQTPVDIIITDLSMPSHRYPDGLTMIQLLTRRYPESTIIVITMITNPDLLACLRRCGVKAVLSKNSLSSTLLNKLHGTTQGAIPAEIPQLRLTLREIEVTRLLLRGMTVNQIGEHLNRTKQTISAQKNSVMRKLGASSDFQLFQYAQRLGLDN